MSCFWDIVFCPFHEECKVGNGCHRALTQVISNVAKKQSLKVVKFTDKPQCFEQKEI